MKSHLCLVICIFMMNISAWAQDENKDQNQTIEHPPLVEVYHDEDVIAPYRERRGNSAFMFTVNYENYVPKNFVSTLDLGSYSDIYGNKPIALIEGQLSYKYNISAGGLVFGVGYGGGSVSDSKSGTKREITITKPSVSLAYVMDTLWEEPYVAPYVQVQAWQIGIKETSPTDSFSASTKPGFNYTVGALIQLNWIDKVGSENATKTIGIENTYLDVFVTQYTKTQSEDDPDTASDFTFGAGIRLEF